MPISAARAPSSTEYPRKRSSPVMSSLPGWARARAAIRWNVTAESSVATLIPITRGSSRIACSVASSYGTPPAAQGLVVAHHIVALREREQQVGAARLRLLRHCRRGGARHDHLVRQRCAPRRQYAPPLVGREVRPPPGVGPHGDAGDR